MHLKLICVLQDPRILILLTYTSIYIISPFSNSQDFLFTFTRIVHLRFAASKSLNPAYIHTYSSSPFCSIQESSSCLLIHPISVSQHPRVFLLPMDVFFYSARKILRFSAFLFLSVTLDAQ